MCEHRRSLTYSFQEVIGFSNLSFYFTLFLYIVSLPGLFSLVTRSVKPSVSESISHSDYSLIFFVADPTNL